MKTLNTSDFITKEFKNNEDFITVASYGLAATLIDPFSKIPYTLAHLALGRQLFLLENAAGLTVYGALWDISMLYLGYTHSNGMLVAYQEVFENLVDHFVLDKPDPAHLVPVFSFDRTYDTVNEKYLTKAVEMIGLKSISTATFSSLMRGCFNNE